MNTKLIRSLFVLLPCAVWSQSGLDSGPWPTQDHDSRRSNQGGFSGPASPGTPQLIYDAGSQILNELAITSDGKLVLGGFSNTVVANRVVAIDATGKPVWPAPFTLIASNNESPIGFTVDASGRIYVATHDWPDIPGPVSVHLYSLLPNGTSAPNWPISIYPALYEPPAIAADGTVYQTDELGGLRALRPSDGSVVWQRSFCCYGQGAIALDSAGNLYAGTDGNNYGSSGLWSWSPGGASRWTRLSGIGGALSDKLFGTPAVSPANTIYVASASGTVYAFDTNGTPVAGWPSATGSPVPSDLGNDPLAVGASETVYIKTVSGVFAINPNGTKKWSYSPGGDGSLSPVVILDKDENVYFAFGNTVYSLTSAGALRWSVPINAPGRLYIGAGGVLYAISAHQQLYAVGSPKPPVIIIPGILGTKMSVANKSDCFGYPPSCVAWLSDAQIAYGGLGARLGLPTNASYFSALQYSPTGQPTIPLVLNDIFNFVPDPTTPDLSHDELDCSQFPLSAFGGCLAWGRDINVYNSLHDRLQAAGFLTTTFPYDWRRDLAALSDDLYLAVRELAFPQQQPARQVALVAHSMGGLLVSGMINRHPDITSSLANVVTLGTPFEGAVDAYLKLQGWKSLQEEFLTSTATQDIGRYWASPYFLLPRRAFVKDANGQLIGNATVYQGGFIPVLFPALARPAALPATSFGAAASKALAIIGSGYLTTTTIQVLNSVQNSGSTVPLPNSCRYYQSDNGDGTVGVASAESSSSAIAHQLFVQEKHLLLPSNQAVLDAITHFLNTGIPPAPSALLRLQAFPPPIFWDTTVCSPADLSAQSSTGQIVANGLIQVQGAHYISSPDGIQITMPATDEYDLGIQGTGVGTFTLILTERDGNNTILQQTAFTNVPVSPAATGSVSVTPTGFGLLRLAVGGTTITIVPGAPLTAMDELKLLSAIVSTLQLPDGTTESLLAKLGATSRALDAGDANAAAGSLNAFINEVQAQADKHIPRAVASGLISIAKVIALLLSSTAH